MRHRLVVRLSFVLVASLALAPALALAQPPSGGDTAELETEARARFQLGQLYYSQARFAEAAREFEAAYATHPHPLLLHNIYLARRDLGDIPGAIDALRRYLAAATDLSAADRRLLEGRLATMERQLPPAETATPTTAETPVTTEPEASEPATTTPAESEAQPVPVPVPVPAPEPVHADGGIGFVPGAVTLGIGAAALVGAAIAGGVALSVQADRDAQCTLPNGECPASLDQSAYASRFASARDAGWGLLIVGAATAAVGAVLLGVGLSQPGTDRPSVAAACDATGCMAVLSGAL